MRLALVVLIALLLGALVGRLSAPGPSAEEAAFPTPGPTRESAGVGVGFSRTREGAVLAAGSYQQALTDAGTLELAELRRRIEAVATPDFAPVMVAANRPGTERLSRGLFGEGVRARVESVFFGVPVSYRLLSYTPERAIVRTWGFTLLGNASRIEPTAFFGLARTVLVWMGGDWKIADTQASFGPTPRLATPHEGGEGFGLIEVLGELERYGLAP